MAGLEPVIGDHQQVVVDIHGAAREGVLAAYILSRRQADGGSGERIVAQVGELDSVIAGGDNEVVGVVGEPRNRGPPGADAVVHALAGDEVVDHVQHDGFAVSVDHRFAVAGSAPRIEGDRAVQKTELRAAVQADFTLEAGIGAINHCVAGRQTMSVAEVDGAFAGGFHRIRDPKLKRRLFVAQDVGVEPFKAVRGTRGAGTQGEGCARFSLRLERGELYPVCIGDDGVVYVAIDQTADRVATAGGVKQTLAGRELMGVGEDDLIGVDVDGGGGGRIRPCGVECDRAAGRAVCGQVDDVIGIAFDGKGFGGRILLVGINDAELDAGIIHYLHHIRAFVFQPANRLAAVGCDQVIDHLARDEAVRGIKRDGVVHDIH